MNAPDPELTLQGGAPIHRQIRDQIRAYIAAGQLRPGEQLPTIRTVAVELAVNPNVVRRAYAELEREGWLSTEEGTGIFVAAPPGGPVAERAARLEHLCGEFLDQAARCGFSAADVQHMIQALRQRRPSS
jgi:GntR family transcriptional regulator